ncbi:MAG: prepilin-type N-terminal cleavage/methylation domain-containing protein, partial [Candidatus Sumerlaeaceae bacterium]
MRNSGFTLIELLIVVAIIAILAAIAVPNFLEAQVRSKVARVHADMRTQAVAIESYAVDNNSYPLMGELLADGSLQLPQHNGAGSPAHKFLMDSITTPIAYITSIPTDPFIV